MESPFEIQIICSTPGDVSRAQRSGATRIELAGCYTAGGVTPSPGTIRSCMAATDLPVIVALRPREGHWSTALPRRDIILKDAEWSLEQGAQNVLIGGLNAQLEFDFDLLEDAIQRFGGSKVMVGRALDSAKKPHRDFERLAGMPGGRLGLQRRKRQCHQGDGRPGRLAIPGRLRRLRLRRRPSAWCSQNVECRLVLLPGFSTTQRGRRP